MAEPIRVDSGAVLDMKLIQSIQIRGSQLGGSFDGWRIDFGAFDGWRLSGNLVQEF